MSENPITQPSANGVAARAKAILTQPKAEWLKIAGETSDPKSVLMSYVVPLAAIGPIASLIGSLAFGTSFFGVTVRPSLGTAIGAAILSFILSVISVFVVAWIANFLSPKFGGKDSFPAAFRLVAYSFTASFLAGIFGLLPALGILALLGLYSLYLFYTGANPVLGVPQDKALGYTAVTVIAAIVLNLIVSALVVSLTGPSVTLGDSVVQLDGYR